MLLSNIIKKVIIQNYFISTEYVLNYTYYAKLHFSLWNLEYYCPKCVMLY